MKLVWCLECGDIFSPGKEHPKRCECGYTIAKWYRTGFGMLQVASRLHRGHLRVLGLNNDWLITAKGIHSNSQHTAETDLLHKHWAERTSQEAEGYLFKSRNCPVIMVDVLEDRSDVVYAEFLLKEVPWYGKNDCMLAKATGSIST